MPRFVILEHDYPFLHWDLMLEFGALLRTWRLLDRPEPGRSVRAEPLGDHRKMYLDHEGPVSGNRGSVSRWEAGTFELERDEAEHVAVRLQGQALHGLALLTSDSSGRWSFLLSSPSGPFPPP